MKTEVSGKMTNSALLRDFFSFFFLFFFFSAAETHEMMQHTRQATNRLMFFNRSQRSVVERNENRFLELLYQLW